MLAFQTLKNKNSDFLNSNTCFCSRSDLKNPNYFNFSSFFGDFCLKFFGVIEKELKKIDEKGRVTAGI